MSNPILAQHGYSRLVWVCPNCHSTEARSHIHQGAIPTCKAMLWDDSDDLCGTQMLSAYECGRTTVYANPCAAEDA